eukprot:c9705_g1_i2.p1 GENE.c9705_g1_i2~~c9705_g1_i2.p1  ORF type:complete len:248 (+),score=35.73 c9705_g1_i2:492-1235(+)
MLQRTFLSPDSPFEARLVDESDREAMIWSIRPKSQPSSFSELHRAAAKPSLARNFLSASTEEESRAFVAKADRVLTRPSPKVFSETSSAATSDGEGAVDDAALEAAMLEAESVTGESVSSVSEFARDEREPHQCYNRIDARIRQMHRFRRLDLCLLSAIEAALVDALFPSDATRAQECIAFSLDNSYQRLILHGLCQYYGAISRSFDDANGRRITEARRHDAWQRLVPMTPLVVFLTRDGAGDRTML